MAMLRLRGNTQAAREKLRRVRRALSPAAQDIIVRKVAWVWHRRMVERTPKRWTGQTRRDWLVQNLSSGTRTAYRVGNGNKVMIYLEHGTKGHGPKRAKRLFVPLTRRAMLAGPRVVMADLMAVRASAEQGQKVRPKYKVGVDYVWAKWVKGIKALRIVAQAQPFMRGTLTAALKQFIKHVVEP